MKVKDHSLDWARDAATSVHCYTASPPQEAQGSFIGLGEGCSHIDALLYCIAHLKKLKDHSLDWARDAATSVHCYTASPPHEAQGSFIGLGEGCSHIDALLYCIAPLMKLKDHSLDWARDAATSMHCYTASPPS